jgi:hypothetical protein
MTTDKTDLERVCDVMRRDGASEAVIDAYKSSTTLFRLMQHAEAQRRAQVPPTKGTK